MHTSVLYITVVLATVCGAEQHVNKRGIAGSLEDSFGGGGGHGAQYGSSGYDSGAFAPITVHKVVNHHIKVPVVKVVEVPVEQPIPVFIPKAVPVPVPQPYQVIERIPERVEVPIVKTVHVPVEKPYEVPVEKRIPVPVEKPYVITVDKYIEVPVPKPYPVRVPVYKHVYHGPKKHHVHGWH